MDENMDAENVAAMRDVITATLAVHGVKPVRGDLGEGERTKATPGPWVAVLNEAQDHRADVVTDCLCVATCGTGNLALANARLIARAPELLAKNARLRAALGAIANGTQVYPWLPRSEINRLAVAALAKGGGL